MACLYAAIPTASLVGSPDRGLVVGNSLVVGGRMALAIYSGGDASNRDWGGRYLLPDRLAFVSPLAPCG